MPKKLKIKTMDQDGSSEEVTEIEFSNDDWETLRDYAKYATELGNNSLVKLDIPSAIRINWSQESGLRVETELPEDEQIDALLMKLRPFMLDNECTHFNSVCNIVKKATPNKSVREHLATLRRHFSGEHLQSIFVVGASSNDVPDGQIINSEETLKLWLNGFRFHRDKKKQKIFDSIHGIMPPEHSVALFLRLLADKVHAILGLQRMIELFSGAVGQLLVEILPEEPIHYRAYLHPTISFLQFVTVTKGEELPFPIPGLFERSFDLTPLGRGSVASFVDLFSRLWRERQLTQEAGIWYYSFRVAEGFETPSWDYSPSEIDIVVQLRIQALLVEDPSHYERRKPAQALRERMNRERKATKTAQVPLKTIETRLELDKFLDREPRPEIEWHTVPRVAFRFAYWPISKRAQEKVRQILDEGREPSFEEVEGMEISRAWEDPEVELGETILP